ncbi:GAF and ANTAR domain-containing protein [Gordonia sp. NPDC058843]|uniref:GAF and ANTAR domain-containing protein n=1 Tax=Gordonia sp. NPDC058843 TaxID=3346648 RepID=UPI00368E79CE
MTAPDEMSAVDGADVHTHIARLARAVHGSAEDAVTPPDVLDHVTESAVRLLAAVDHAGITLVHKRHRTRPPELESTAETGPVARTFDALQHEHGQGPCFDAIWLQQTVIIDDVDTEDRWPSFITAVRTDTPIRACLSLQLYVTDLELGALNLFSETPHAFDPNTEDLATMLATHAAIALDTAKRGQQFRSALASRDIIGQAKGMIMERYDTDSLQAFGILRQLSQDTNCPVSEVAARLVDADHPIKSDRSNRSLKS